MKLLALSDIHSNFGAIEKLREKIKEGKDSVELIAIAGDITSYGSRDDAEKGLMELEKICKKIFFVPGNLDTREVIEFFEEKELSLHAKKAEFKGYDFIGFGGSVKSVGDIVFQEKEIYETLKKLFEEAGNSGRTILLTHSPPKNTKIDLSRNGMHIGSEAVRKITEEEQPLLNLCGHVHEAGGEVMLKKTKCINVGPLKYGLANIIEIEENKIKVKRIHLE
ncbi:MAG: metallophosphoesterase [Candidatus Diapherotrites archaeon]